MIVYDSKMDFLRDVAFYIRRGYHYCLIVPDGIEVKIYNRSYIRLGYGSLNIIVSRGKGKRMCNIHNSPIALTLDDEEFYIHGKHEPFVRLAPERYQALYGELKTAVECFNALQAYPEYVYTGHDRILRLFESAKAQKIILKQNGNLLEYCGKIENLPPMRIESKNGYLCTTWQGFLQQFIINLSIGYYWVHSYRIEKYKRWTKCDKVIMEKFQTDIGKDARYRRKKAGKANYLYLRYRDLIVIMRNEGEISEHEKEDGFVDIRRKPFTYRLSMNSQFRLLVRYSGKDFSLFLHKNSYRDIRIKIRDFIICHDVRAAIATFDALNGIPCYAGMIFDKRRMMKYTLKLAREHHIKLNRDDFRINTRLKIRKVYDDDPANIVAT